MGQSLRRDVLDLALPAFLSLVAPPLFLLVDAGIVGTLGTTALAALGAGSAVFSTVVGLSFFLAYHTTGSVARAMGAGDQSKALQVAGSTLALGLILGAVLNVMVFIFAAPLLQLMGVGEAVLAPAIDWLRAVSFALPGALAGMAAVGLFRGLKDTRTPLVVTVIQVIINAVLCWAFILVFDFGVAGSGAATAIAETAGLVMYGIALHRHLPSGLQQLVPTGLGDLWNSLRDGSALIWRSFMLRGVLSGVVIAAAHLGDKPLAAFHVSYVVWYTLALALDAIAVAAQAIIGCQIGMHDTAAARTTLNTMLRWGALLGTVQAAAVAVASPLIAQGFSQDPEVRRLITLAVIAVCLHQPLAAIVFVLDGVLIGAGDTKYLAFVHTIAFAIFLPLAAVVVHLRLHLLWLWGVMVLFIAVRAVLLTLRARGEEWMYASR